MAYDLILQRLTPHHCGRGERPSCLPPENAGLISLVGKLSADAAVFFPIGYLGVMLLVALGERRSEHSIRRRAHRDDPRVTQKVPAISMKELVYGGDR